MPHSAVPPTAPQHKTDLGRGRCLIRAALQGRLLAETVQVCVGQGRTTKEYYSSTSVLANAVLAQKLIDLLYHLNVVAFRFSRSRLGLAPACMTPHTAK